MAHDSHENITVAESERQPLDQGASNMSRICLVVGVVLLVIAALVAWATDTTGLRRFLFAYVVGFALIMSLTLGSMFFVFVQYAVKAGWSVAVRRPAELVASTAWPYLPILFLPILISVLWGHGYLYPWAQPRGHAAEEHASAETIHLVASEAESHAAPEGTIETHKPSHDHGVQAPHGGGGADELPEGRGTSGLPHANRPFEDHSHYRHPEQAHAEIAAGYKPVKDYTGDHLIEHRSPYLNTWFFVIRWLVYLAIWTAIARFYFNTSVKQDETADPHLTLKMQWWSYLSIAGFALTTTFAAIDLLMSLDAVFYSTIFGVHFFAGSMIGSLSLLALTLMMIQRFGGRLRESVTTEHYHDIGKLLKGFTLFWAYVSFSQYMLLWYGAIPEEVIWWEAHGASTAVGKSNAWTPVLLLLLICHFVIPFLGLMSRHVKRSRAALAFWCSWLFVWHIIDLWWLVMPQLSSVHLLWVVELLTVAGMLAILASVVLRRGSQVSLLPYGDPRLGESLNFENV